MSGNLGQKKVINNSLLYTIGQLGVKASSFIFMPIYVRLLDTQEYGIVTLITSFIFPASIVFMVAINHAVIRFYNEYSSEKELRAKYIGTIITFVIISSLVGVLFLIATHNQVASYLFKDIEFYPYVFFGLIALFFETIYQVIQSILQAKQDGRSYILNSICYVVINIILNVLFLVVGHMKAEGMLLSLMITNVVMAVKSLYCLYAKGDFFFCLDLNILSTNLLYSVPLLPHTLSNSIATFISRLFLNTAKSIYSVAIYSVVSQFGSIIDIFQSSINLAFRPWFNENIKLGEEGKKRIVRLADTFFLLSSIICLAIMLFSKEIVLILTPEQYHSAWKIVLIISMAHAVKFIYYTHVLILMYDINSSRSIFLYSTGASLLNIVLCSCLVKSMDLYGVAVSFLISRIAISIAIVYKAKKIKLLNYDLRSMLGKLITILCASAVGLVFSMFYLPESIDIREIIYKMAVMVITVGIRCKRNPQVIQFFHKYLSSIKVRRQASDQENWHK